MNKITSLTFWKLVKVKKIIVTKNVANIFSFLIIELQNLQFVKQIRTLTH